MKKYLFGERIYMYIKKIVKRRAVDTAPRHLDGNPPASDRTVFTQIPFVRAFIIKR